MRHYRKALLSKNPLARSCHLAFAALCYPEKLLKRIGRTQAFIQESSRG
jgi:hypothetical protein